MFIMPFQLFFYIIPINIINIYHSFKYYPFYFNIYLVKLYYYLSLLLFKNLLRSSFYKIAEASRPTTLFFNTQLHI
jgi:hypothetical protein